MFVDVIGGFLGSGKTTTILNLLQARAMDPAKTVLLVNEFGLAQLILLNKTDLAQPEAIAAVTTDLERRNPEAVIVPTTYGAFSWDTIGPLLAPLPSADGPTARLEGYESFSAEIPALVDSSAMRMFFQAVSEGRYGDVLRAKGVFDVGDGCARFDLASRRLHETPWPCAGTGGINLVGTEIDRSAIAEALGRATGGDSGHGAGEAPGCPVD